MKQIFALFFALTLGVGQAFAKAEAKTLTIGWDDYPPMQMQEDGQLAGIDIEIVAAVVQGAGYRPEFIKLPWARQMSDLKSGLLDIAMSASVTKERQPFVAWTLPYRTEKTSLFKLASHPGNPASLEELLGGKALVGMMRGSDYSGAIGKLQVDPRFQKLIAPTSSNQNSLNMLRARRFPYVLEDEVTFLYMAQSQKGEPVVEALRLAESDVHFMLSKRTLEKYPGILAALDASLNRLKASGGIERVFSSYGLKP